MPNSKVKTYFAAFLLLLSSISISLLAAEALLRTIFEPVDYLQAHLVRDGKLGHKGAVLSQTVLPFEQSCFPSEK
jgi:hypothetical protein